VSTSSPTETNEYIEQASDYSSISERFQLQTFTPATIVRAWKLMKKKSNVSEDALGISNKMVDILMNSHVAIKLITMLFNASVTQIHVPPEKNRRYPESH